MSTLSAEPKRGGRRAIADYTAPVGRALRGAAAIVAFVAL